MNHTNKAMAGKELIDARTNSSATYLTTEELSQRIKYDARTIRDRLKDAVLLEGRHYIRPFGGRKILYIWEVIEADMLKAVSSPIMASGFSGV